MSDYKAVKGERNMSECVVRMEMPQNCINCDLRYECNAFYAPGKPKPFMKGCMIICQLPEGHGWLVDADELKCIDEQPTVAASPWHRVEEPPKEYGNYLAVVNGEVMEVTYSDISMRDDWNWSTCDAEGFVWIRSESITHWMPLPEPPKEET